MQLALFVGRNRKYVRAAENGDRWHVDDRPAFFAGATKTLYDHGIAEPIIACHRLKVLVALEDELRVVAMKAATSTGPAPFATQPRFSTRCPAAG